MNLPVFDITPSFVEHPDYLNLTIYIDGCPNKCKGCSWKGVPKNVSDYSLDDFKDTLLIYKKRVQCVVFLGGDWLGDTLVPFLKEAHKHGLQTCLYSGKSNMSDINKDLIANLDWLKLGPWIDSLGPLRSPTTNQRFYKIKNGEISGEIKFYERYSK